MLSPISISFVAAGAAIQAKGLLYRFKPSRTGQSPDWSNSGMQPVTHELGSPITDKRYWEGRYALCELTLQDEAGERLVMNDAASQASREYAPGEKISARSTPLTTRPTIIAPTSET